MYVHRNPLLFLKKDMRDTPLLPSGRPRIMRHEIVTGETGYKEKRDSRTVDNLGLESVYTRNSV